jgi:hypothetical protein
MNEAKVLEKSIRKLNQLTDTELKEAYDFIDFLTRRLEDRNMAAAIQKQAEKSSTFQFLEDEEELYTEEDLQVTYR